MTPHLARAAAAVAFTAALSTAAAGQAFPTQNVRLIVPFAGGSPSDVVARFLAEHLKASLNGTVYVENKPSAATTARLMKELGLPQID